VERVSGGLVPTLVGLPDSLGRMTTAASKFHSLFNGLHSTFTDRRQRYQSLMRAIVRHASAGQLGRRPTAHAAYIRAYSTKSAKDLPKSLDAEAKPKSRKASKPTGEPAESKKKPRRKSKSYENVYGDATTPVAERLAKSGIWNPRIRGARNLGPGMDMQAIDSRRVNIVSERLCGMCTAVSVYMEKRFRDGYTQVL
jgi:hypothetical protein